MRLLYYTNELDIVGLVYGSSVHHWQGDGEHTLKQAKELGLITSFKGETAGSPARSDDAKTWRWEPLGWMEEKVTEDYNQVYPNLVKHDPNYPSPAELWSKIAVGNTKWENDFHEDTPGSNLIKNALLDADQRPLYLEAWGGTNTIARALKSIEQQYKGTADWATIQAKVNKKAVIATIGQQDNAYNDYISKSWPGVKVLDLGTVFGGFTSFAKDNAPAAIKPYYQASFWATNIKYGHGAVLDHYGLIGDGTYIAGEGNNLGWQPGQAKDLSTWKMFNSRGGYQRLDWTSEGDSPSFMFLVPTGLRGVQDPSLGGWGGRLNPSTTPGYYSGVADLNPNTNKSDGTYSIARFMPAIGNDFAARADWGITDRYSDANHAPKVSVPSVSLQGRPGQTVQLRVDASDPDRDALKTEWSVYTEASTVTGTPTLSGNRSTATIKIPASATPGQRIVVIAAVSDSGTPSLTRYGQIVVTVK
ncbi:nucleoside hydrolase-like domain-containing protein [Dactylosporangium sp. CA-233914]|uniref:DUF1593 domain-containing protein n=1 Tax=Dactylosporangium sp. CA-233914 TaxID=3239934 RepID=UPI003D8E8F6E